MLSNEFLLSFDSSLVLAKGVLVSDLVTLHRCGMGCTVLVFGVVLKGDALAISIVIVVGGRRTTATRRTSIVPKLWRRSPMMSCLR